MKTLKIKATPPLLTAASNKTHVSTTWEVSISPDFTIVSKILLSKIEDTDNLIELIENISTDKKTVYVRIKFHFSDDSESSWSNALPVSLEDTKLKISDVIVNTPIVEYTLTTTDSVTILNITTSKFSLYNGVNHHIATTWEILDNNNNIVFSRRDSTNLTKISMDNTFLIPNKIYHIRVTHHSANNTDSNYGRCVISNNISDVRLFDLTLKYDLVPKRWAYFELILNTENFYSVDLILENSDGTILYHNDNQQTTTPNLYVDYLDLNIEYIVKGRIKLYTYNGTTYSNYVEVYRGKPMVNEVIPKNIYSSYLDKYTFTQEYNTNGNTIQSSVEMYDGSILLYNGTGISRHVIYNGNLVDTGDMLPDTAEYPAMDRVINTLPLSNGRVLVEERIVTKIGIDNPLVDIFGLPHEYGVYGDIEIMNIPNTYDKRHIEYGTKFTLYEFNVITKKYTKLSKIIFPNAHYGTAINNSLVETDSVLYFIFNTEVTQGFPLQTNKPVLYKIDVSNDNLTTVTTGASLPNNGDEANIRGNYNLFKLDEFTIGLSGGSTEILDDPDTATHENVASRLSEKIYTYNNITDEFFNNPVSVAGIIPDDIYSLSSNTRKDGKIIFFNAVTSGTGIGNQDTYVYDPKTRIMSRMSNDTVDDMMYNNTIYLRNGDLLRMSNRVLDPQLVYTYVSNTYTEDQLVNNTTINRLTNLTVPVGTTVNIDDPFIYSTIDIEGTSDSNTGILLWTDEDGNTHEFMWNDLLVPNTRTISEDAVYDTITILEDAVLVTV